MDVDSRGGFTAGDLLGQAPMVMVAVDRDGRIVVAAGGYLGEVLGPDGPYAGHLLSDLSAIATILPDLVGRALGGVESVGRLAMADGFLSLRAVPSVDPSGLVVGAVVQGTPELPQVSSDEAFMRLFRASPVPISISTLETGIFSHCNDAFVRSFGYPREEVVGRGSVELGMWTPAQRVAAMDQLKTRGVLVGHQSTVQTKDGDVRDVVFNMEPIEFAGRLHLVGFFYDITETKRAEAEQRRLYQQLLELAELKGQFIANVSHELRTPLTLIVGLSDRLAGGLSADANQTRDAHAIQRNALILLRQVNDLLDIARLDAVRPAAQYQAVDLAADLRVFGSVFDVLAREKALTYEIDAPLALEAETDPDKFERIATNLLANAFKFTPAGGAIRCELARRGDEIVLAVTDTGPGIAPEHRDSVFQRFFQVEGGATRTHGGTGLGLAIVRELVESLGGHVDLSGEVGVGARFEVTLPATAPSGTEVSPRSGLHALPDGLRGLSGLVGGDDSQPWLDEALDDDGRGLVLVVEDNVEMARFVAESLAEVHRVVVASNGEEGLARAKALRPDVVLTDVMMPRMSGDMLAAALRVEPGMEDVRVVVFTAKTDDAFRARLLTEGVHDFITKPFSINELRARVTHQVRVKQRDDARLAAAREQQVVMDRMYRQLQQAQKMEAIARLAGGVAHDFNNLLTVIGGYASLLGESANEPEVVQELAREISGASSRAAALTRQLLTFGRKQVVHPVPTNPNEAIIGLQRMFRHIVGNSVEVVVELTEQPCLVHMDPTQLDQVLVNLVINARDAMPHGGQILLRTTVVECRSNADCVLDDADLPTGDYVSLEVCDTGEGVDADAREHIFEPFYSTKDFGKGTGLGLAIVHGIVTQSGGRITCDSEAGRGTVFRIIVPRLSVGVPTRVAPPTIIQSKAPGCRVLVVDDETSVREFIARRLTKLGFEVLLATSGLDALRQIDDGLAAVDLVISDVTMPELDGIELASRLASRWPAVPIILISGYMEDGPLREMGFSGAARLLEKPFSASELDQAVRHTLGGIA